MQEALACFEDVEGSFERCFGRRYGAVESVCCPDADIVLVTSGTITGTARQVVEELRAEGENVGLLKMKLFRPFPVDLVRRILGPAQKIAVIDRNFSFGASGIFAQEIRAALCGLPQRPVVFGYIAGLGGRDVTGELIREIYRHTRDHAVPESDSVWMGLREVTDGA